MQYSASEQLFVFELLLAVLAVLRFIKRIYTEVDKKQFIFDYKFS